MGIYAHWNPWGLMAENGPKIFQRSIEIIEEAPGLSRRRSRVRAPSLPPPHQGVSRVIRSPDSNVYRRRWNLAPVLFGITCPVSHSLPIALGRSLVRLLGIGTHPCQDAIDGDRVVPVRKDEEAVPA